MAEVLEELDRLVLARELVRAGLRTPFVQHLCGVTQRQVAALWRAIHGDAPMKGKLHESSAGFLGSRGSHALYSGYAAFHQAVAGQDHGPAALLASWREYRALVGAHLDINGCYYVLRDLRVGEIRLARCHGCRASYINEFGRRARRCPFCGERTG